MKKVFSCVLVCMLLLCGCGKAGPANLTLQDGSMVEVSLVKDSDYSIRVEEESAPLSIVDKDGQEVIIGYVSSYDYVNIFEEETLTEGEVQGYKCFVTNDVGYPEVIILLEDRNSSIVLISGVFTEEELQTEVGSLVFKFN